MGSGGSIGRAFVEIGANTSPLVKDIDNAVKVMGEADAKLSAYGNRISASFQNSLNPTIKLEKQLTALGVAGQSSADIVKVFGDRVISSTDAAIRHGQAISPLMQSYRDLAKETEQTSDKMWQQRGAAMMLENYLGVRLPRSVNTFLAQSSAIGPILGAAFSATVFVTLGVAVFEMGKKFADSMGWLGKSAEEMAKARTEAEKFAESLTKAGNAYAQIGLGGQPLKGLELKQAEAAAAAAKSEYAKLQQLVADSRKTTRVQMEGGGWAEAPTPEMIAAREKLTEMGITDKNEQDELNKLLEKHLQTLGEVSNLRKQIVVDTDREKEEIRMAGILLGKTKEIVDLTVQAKALELQYRRQMDAEDYAAAENTKYQMEQVKQRLKAEENIPNVLKMEQEMQLKQIGYEEQLNEETGKRGSIVEMAVQARQKELDIMKELFLMPGRMAFTYAPESQSVQEWLSTQVFLQEQDMKGRQAQWKKYEEAGKKAIDSIRDSAGHIFDDLMMGSKNIWQDLLRSFENIFLAPVRIAFQNLAQWLFTGRGSSAGIGSIFATPGFAGGWPSSSGGGSGVSLGGIWGGIKGIFTGGGPTASATGAGIPIGAPVITEMGASIPAIIGAGKAAPKGLSVGGQLGATALVMGGGMVLSDAWRRGSYIEGIGGGAATGAGMGMMIGSAIPGLGTAVGAAVGAAIGALAGIFTGIFGGGEAARQREIARRANIQSQYYMDAPVSYSHTGAFGSEGDVDVETNLMGRAQGWRSLPPIVVNNYMLDGSQADAAANNIANKVGRKLYSGGSYLYDDINWAAGQ